MTENTTPDGILKPGGPDPFKLLTFMAGLSDSIQIALNKRGSIAVSSLADRAARYPSPVQGNAVYRLDKNYEERYYGVYNAATNPGGKDVAGWYAPAGTFLGTYDVAVTVANNDDGHFAFGDNPQVLAEYTVPDPGVAYRVQMYTHLEVGSTQPGTRWDVSYGVGRSSQNAGLRDVVGVIVCDDGVVDWVSNTSLVVPPVYRGAQRMVVQANRVYGASLGKLTQFNRSFRVSLWAA